MGEALERHGVAVPDGRSPRPRPGRGNGAWSTSRDVTIAGLFTGHARQGQMSAETPGAACLTALAGSVTERPCHERSRIAVSAAKSDSGFDIELPRSLKAERRGEIALLRLARPEKRNALDDPTVLGIETFFASLPEAIKAVVLARRRRAFLRRPRSRRADRAQHRPRHRAFAHLASRVRAHRVRQGAGGRGAARRGGRRRARACCRDAISASPSARPITRCRKARAASSSAAAASVRLPRLIGIARMMDMMLTGRTYGAEEGQAIGLSHYLVDAGAGLGQGHRARQAHRRQCADDQFRRHARAAAHRRAGSGQRLPHRGADRGDRAGRRRGQGAAQGVPREARAQDACTTDEQADFREP